MFLLALTVAILIPVVSNATVSRYLGVGGAGTQFIIYDASNPGIYPSLTTKWTKLLGAEFGTATGAWDNFLVYSVWDFGEGKSVIKFVLDKTSTSVFDVNSLGVFALPTGGNLGGSFHQLNILYGRPMGDVDVGLGLRFEGKAMESDLLTTATDDDLTSSYSSFGATFGVTALEKKLDAALAVDFAGFSREMGPTTTVENDGSMQISVLARYWHAYSSTSTLVPHFRFVSHNLGWTTDDGTTTTNLANSWTDIVLGLGHNWRPLPNTLVVFEVGLDLMGMTYDNGTDETTDTRTDIYWRAGGETRINSWLWGRMGAVRQWSGNVDETVIGADTFESTMNYTTTSTYLGATTHWNRLHIDFLVMPDFLRFGPDFIGGGTNGVTSRLSLKFEFDEANWLP
jgi:hypothetical protein